LAINKVKAAILQTTKNKRNIWNQIASAASEETTLKVSHEQARERFYTLKRGYRKYLTKSKKKQVIKKHIFLSEN